MPVYIKGTLACLSGHRSGTGIIAFDKVMMR